MAQFNSNYTGNQIETAISKITNASSNLAHLGCGIGTCSTAAATAAKVVTLSNYELVKNGFVAVTFQYDVPASATLNINSKGAKPIYYKGSAITADTIKADDTVMFAYNGSQYVVTSLGGGTLVNPNEIVSISLTQVGGNSADLIGAAITITNDDTSETIFTATWNGNTITTEIQMGTYYTVSVETITGYLTCAPQSYQAVYQMTRNIGFQYRASGAFIEAIDGTLYRASNWSSSGKTPNSIVVLSDVKNFRIALVEADKSLKDGAYNWPSLRAQFPNNITDSDALVDYNGLSNTLKFMQAHARDGQAADNNCGAVYCRNYIFPDGVTQGYLPAAGEIHLAFLNKNAVNECLSTLGLQNMTYTGNSSGRHFLWSSTVRGIYQNDWLHIFCSNEGLNWFVGAYGIPTRPFGAYDN